MNKPFAIIGSVATKYHFGDFSRDPVDLDIISEDGISGTDYHYHPAFESVLKKVGRTHIVDANTLYTIKVSHSFWDIAWGKTMHDIIFFQQKECELDTELYSKLYKAWEEVHGKKKANLNVMAEDFFQATVKRLYEHDSIHASIAYYDKPMYFRILKDGADVMVDRSKWEVLSYEDKLKTVREEVYATALERLMIPSDYKYSPRGAYAWALKKTIISFSKGWFPLFIVDNFSVLSKPDIDYVKRHKENSNRLILLEK